MYLLFKCFFFQRLVSLKDNLPVEAHITNLQCLASWVAFSPGLHYLIFNQIVTWF